MRLSLILPTVYNKYTAMQKELDEIRNSYYDMLGSKLVDAELYYYAVKRIFEKVQKAYKIT